MKTEEVLLVVLLLRYVGTVDVMGGLGVRIL